MVFPGNPHIPLSIIGQPGGSKNNASSIVDVAVMQSLISKGEVKDIVKNYGMIIVDECHHVSAFSFEQILKTANARYVYGLTRNADKAGWTSAHNIHAVRTYNL